MCEPFQIPLLVWDDFIKLFANVPSYVEFRKRDVIPGLFHGFGCTLITLYNIIIFY